MFADPDKVMVLCIKTFPLIFKYIFSLQFDNVEDTQQWKVALEDAIASVLGDNEVRVYIAVSFVFLRIYCATEYNNETIRLSLIVFGKTPCIPTKMWSFLNRCLMDGCENGLKQTAFHHL